MRVIEKTSWSASSDVSVLPVIPCFVLDTTSTEFWYVTTSGSTKVSGGGGGAVSGVKGDAESTYRTGTVNLTPANIGALALTGGTLTNSLAAKFSGFDLSKANNNISSVIYPTTFNILDSAGRISARMENVVNPNGNNGFYLYARNYNTSGSSVAQKGISLHINKSGAGSWSVDDPASFRAAISSPGAVNANGYWGITRPDGNTTDYLRAPQNGFIPYQSGGSGYLGTSSWPWNYIYGKNIYINGTALGKRVWYYQNTAKSVPSGTATLIASIDLTAGNWIVYANLRFKSTSTTGARLGAITSGTSIADVDYDQNAVQAASVPSGWPIINLSTSSYVASGTKTLRLFASQNSGSAMNVTGIIMATLVGHSN